ncbi:MAG TPA: type VI secretion system tip protein TssI/VgrG [Labilithrix sp.]|nr:type VI secretion system tip protein TssI/VgrG [Labilithrix sp.]
MSFKPTGDEAGEPSGAIAVEGADASIRAAEGGSPDVDGRVKGATSGVAVKAGLAVAGAVEKAIGGAAGKVTGVLAGGVAAVAVDLVGQAKKGAPRANLVEEMPVFEDIAITSSSPVNAMQGATARAKATVAGGLAGIARKLGEKNMGAEIGSGDKLDVRQFSVHDRLASLFQVNLVVVSDNPSIEFDDVVGQPAKFSIAAGMHDRFWSGVCNHFEQVRVEPSGLSTYQLSIVPTLWLLTQRKNHRMFQQISEPDIALKLLTEWGIEPVVRLDKGAYKKRKYRVQYAESDFAFMSRMLEDAGITFSFEQDGDETKLVLSDAPQGNPKRGAALAFLDDTSMVKSVAIEFATSVRMGQRVRPGKYTMRDHDYRKPANYKLLSSVSKGLAVEEKLERFQYVPGAFLFGAESGEATPSADDKGKARTDEKEAAALAQKRLDAKRGSARMATFETNAYDLAPGVVLEMSGHPHAALGEGKSLLVVETSLSGASRGEWSQHCEVRGTDVPFRPELSTPRPKVDGVESATVVGPAGEEIHTDEFGRVRVHFHWDRESKMDDNSSCWIHVSQPWGGAGYGGTALPRIGQEVLVDFLGGDPDRPVIVGRVYTNLQKTPYKLPENKTQSGLKSNSTGGGGGYNEIMFEDAQGKELVRMQAEKDLNKLVKHDEQVTIGNDRTREVKRNESVTVGKNRTKQVVQNERVTIGQNQSVTVGVNRSAQIGSIDSTMVGDTYVAMISPPGELAPSPSSSIVMTDKKIVLDTGAGASITLRRDTITISAKKIKIVAKDHVHVRGSKTGIGLAAPIGGTQIVSGKSLKLASKKVSLSGKDVKVKGSKLALAGEGSAKLTSKGPTTVSGTPVQLNGPGLFAGRVTELAPATITTGAALVLVGGASFPLPVVKQADGSLKIGDNIIVQPGTGRYGDFQAKVMRDLGVMSSTPSGLERLNNIQNNPGGHDVMIREYSAQEAIDYGTNNSLAYRNDANGLMTYDANGNPVPGSGSGTVIAYNPDIRVGASGNPAPADATLFHEMGHAEHNAYGMNRAGETMGDGWHNREEWQNIEGGVNHPNSDMTVPNVPTSPTENDYLGDRDYPYRRTDHGSGYESTGG